MGPTPPLPAGGPRVELSHPPRRSGRILMGQTGSFQKNMRMHTWTPLRGG